MAEYLPRATLCHQSDLATPIAESLPKLGYHEEEVVSGLTTLGVNQLEDITSLTTQDLDDLGMTLDDPSVSPALQSLHSNITNGKFVPDGVTCYQCYYGHPHGIPVYFHDNQHWDSVPFEEIETRTFQQIIESFVYQYSMAGGVPPAFMYFQVYIKDITEPTTITLEEYAANTIQDLVGDQISYIMVLPTVGLHLVSGIPPGTTEAQFGDFLATVNPDAAIANYYESLGRAAISTSTNLDGQSLSFHGTTLAITRDLNAPVFLIASQPLRQLPTLDGIISSEWVGESQMICRCMMNIDAAQSHCIHGVIQDCMIDGQVAPLECELFCDELYVGTYPVNSVNPVSQKDMCASIRKLVQVKKEQTDEQLMPPVPFKHGLVIMYSSEAFNALIPTGTNSNSFQLDDNSELIFARTRGLLAEAIKKRDGDKVAIEAKKKKAEEEKKRQAAEAAREKERQDAEAARVAEEKERLRMVELEKSGKLAELKIYKPLNDEFEKTKVSRATWTYKEGIYTRAFSAIHNNAIERAFLAVWEDLDSSIVSSISQYKVDLEGTVPNDVTVKDEDLGNMKINFSTMQVTVLKKSWPLVRT